MGNNVAIPITLVFSAVSVLVSVLGFFTSRDKHTSENARWQGTVDTNLKDIKDGVASVSDRLVVSEKINQNHEIRITLLEKNVYKDDDYAKHCLDRILKENNNNEP